MYQGTGEYFAQASGLGALPTSGNPYDPALAQALVAWSKSPDNDLAKRRLYAVAMLWGSRLRASTMSHVESDLKYALRAWGLRPNDPRYRQWLLGAAWKWSAARRAGTNGVGEYFAANGMGEYFAADGLGADAGTTSGSVWCFANEQELNKNQIKMASIGGAVGLGVGLFASMMIFRK